MRPHLLEPTTLDLAMTTMTANQQKRRVRDSWNAAADAWDRQFDWYSSSFAPLMDWCCDAAALAPGDRVLDLACGTGEPAITAAQRVGAAGSVLATDLAPEMVAATARRAAALSLGNVACRVMDAEYLDAPAASFDAVTFACGLMFCPRPAAAIAEIRRVLRSGGRFAIAVWDDPAGNEFATIMREAASAVMNVPVPAPDTPGPFRLAPVGMLASVLRDGGLTRFEVAPFPMTITYPSVDEYVRISIDLAGVLGQRLRALPATDFERFQSLARTAAARFARADGAVCLRATPLCAWGRKTGDFE